MPKVSRTDTSALTQPWFWSSSSLLVLSLHSRYWTVTWPGGFVEPSAFQLSKTKVMDLLEKRKATFLLNDCCKVLKSVGLQVM